MQSRARVAHKLEAVSRDKQEREAAALAARKQQAEEAAARRQSQLDAISQDLAAQQDEVSLLAEHRALRGCTAAVLQLQNS